MTSSSPTPIRSKPQMYRLLRGGLLGNTLRTWPTATAFQASGFAGRCSLRSTIPRVPYQHGLTSTEALMRAEPHHIFCEAAPEDRVVLQGEVQRGPHGLDLHWTTEKANLRVAMRNAHRADGVVALVLLRSFVDPPSYDDLMDILDLYPDHVIEFATFAEPLGDCGGGRRTVIWEVRSY